MQDTIPKPATPFTNGKIYDANGDTVHPVKHTFMARFDAKASEKVELSRGTVWLIGISLVLAGVIFSYGGSALSWAREDQATRERTIQTQRDVEEMRKDLKEMKDQFNEIQKAMQAQREQEAVKRGYELKAAEGDHGRK